jgi:2-polyprenyl-3-methyl-5-hydroxy-6-metoxy-1,4-benzoquinol methylase
MKEAYPIIKWEVRDGYNTQFENEKFDYVVIGEVIEHLENPTHFITEALRILKPGGVLAISTPLEEEKEFGAVDAERHLWSFSEQDILDILSIHGSVETQILRSLQEPYKYCWPQLVAFCIKK